MTAAEHRKNLSGRSKKSGPPDLLGASFPPAAGISAWGVNLKTPRYTLLREGPSPLEKLFMNDSLSSSGTDHLANRHRRRHHKSIATTGGESSANDEGHKITSRISPGAPYYSSSFAVSPKITDVNVWTMHEESGVVMSFAPANFVPTSEAVQPEQVAMPVIFVPHGAASDDPKAAAGEPASSKATRFPSPQIVALPPPPQPLASSGEVPAYMPTAFVAQPYVLPQAIEAPVVFDSPRKIGQQPSASPLLPNWPQKSAIEPGILRPTPFTLRAKAVDRTAAAHAHPKNFRRRFSKRSSASSQSANPSLHRKVNVRRRHANPSYPTSATRARGHFALRGLPDTASAASGGSDPESILRTSTRRFKLVRSHHRSHDPDTKSVHFAEEGQIAMYRKIPASTKKILPTNCEATPPSSTHATRRVGCTGC
eukprot:Gregarina_sp_Poly_1__1820@NODE_1472_length_4056_cov_103_411632_g975_i0_p1_GENE_NODE_1472_length_4056_cov_103_411632_g975_i0NODE_1472_length_4056_cov_103_411632_g975_i0_p1_ORF_typecomplete_len425_score50_53_NODE_1472_length_4056_cov_103_411632_g975_i018753149